MKTKEENPAFGMINISRVQSSGTILFGSRIKHSDYIQLEIHSAEKERDAYAEYYHPKKSLIVVSLSAAQFANMLIKSNTTGVPCTLNYTSEEGYIESLKTVESVKTEIEKDTRENLDELKTLTKKLSHIIKNDFKGQINKDKKEEIRTLAIQIENGLNSNLDFLYSRQVSKLEKVGVEIIAEAEAKISSLIMETGIETLKQNQKLIKE